MNYDFSLYTAVALFAFAWQIDKSN